jgi:hypothetical protein
MKTTVKYIAPLLAAATIGGAIVLAPVAIAAPGPLPVATPTATAGHASAPARDGTGIDPLVPDGTGARPYVPYYSGMDEGF